jgi:hypothetical protein
MISDCGFRIADCGFEVRVRVVDANPQSAIPNPQLNQ